MWYVQAQLENVEVATGMRQLMARLHAARLGMGPAQWRVVCRELVAPHPLRALVHESPLTRQAHDKPRGYAGDPELLDFIYELAALPAHTGLYDHLRGDSAMQLTASLFRRLRPRGRLVLASSAPDSPQIAYVEAFMDWWLSYRAEDAMRRLAAAVPKQELAGLRVSRDPLENLVFLELSRG